MKTALLIIDPQNDFHDIDPDVAPGSASPALAVIGACNDSKRLSDFIERNKTAINQVFVTVDTHSEYDIGHSMFWQDANGKPVDPFTTISSEDIESGRYSPIDQDLKEHTLNYTKSLEAGGRFSAMVWPTHCILGTWGWCLYRPVSDAIKAWESAADKECFIKKKGKNQFTEHYGAFSAEYVIEDDPETKLDKTFLENLAEHDVILVGGQALSHCVGESVRQMVQTWPKELVKKIVLLRDTTSAVPGFEEFAEGLVSELQESGVRVMTTADYAFE